jgi:hypothetical protein
MNGYRGTGNFYICHLLFVIWFAPVGIGGK